MSLEKRKDICSPFIPVNPNIRVSVLSGSPNYQGLFNGCLQIETIMTDLSSTVRSENGQSPSFGITIKTFDYVKSKARYNK